MYSKERKNKKYKKIPKKRICGDLQNRHINLYKWKKSKESAYKLGQNSRTKKNKNFKNKEEKKTKYSKREKII
jgi:hypothetical protein